MMLKEVDLITGVNDQDCAYLSEFHWSEDMAVTCIFLMKNRDFKDSYSSTEEIRNTHINSGTSMDISISALAIRIKQEIGFEGSFSFNTSKPDGTLKKPTDVGKITNLGCTHKAQVKNGINIIDH